MKEKVVFLDRDGVINYDSSEYIKSWNEFVFIPKSKKAVKLLSDYGFSIIIISNQSGINRKLILKDELDRIHVNMIKSLGECGGIIKDIFYCPHTPEQECRCRKPKTGLIEKAQKKYNIDLLSSVMVGDSAKDIECAKKSGCKKAILVQTGNGIESEKILSDRNIFPDYIARDIYHAVQWIIGLKS